MKRRFSRFLVRVVILALALSLGFTLVKLVRRLGSAQAELDEVQEEIEAMQAKNDKLEYDIAHSTDDDVISGFAQEKLGLGYEDETVFYGN